MSPDSDGSDAATLAPDDAFAALGNETRMAILLTSSRADGPLTFSEPPDSVGIPDSDSSTTTSTRSSATS